MALNSMFNSAPNISSEFVEKGMTMLGNVDAFFTTGSAAISYDYHYRKVLETGIGEAAAHDTAMKAAEATVYRTAQPSEMSDRSLFELGLSPFARTGFMFMTAPRQQAALEYMAIRNLLTGQGTKGEFARVLFLMHVLVPSLMWAITAMWRDLRDDDDDEVFDLEHWNARDLLVAMALGPLGAIPGVSALSDTLMGQFHRTPIGDTWASVKKVTEDGFPENTEELLKTTRKLLTGASSLATVLGPSQIARLSDIMGVSAKLLEQIHQLMDNFSGEPDD